MRMFARLRAATQALRGKTVEAHDQKVTRRYVVHFPAHEPRKSDPHYFLFEQYRRATHKTARCAVGEHRGDFSECGGQLELHHSHIEFALQNGVDLNWLHRDFPEVTSVSEWVESQQNLMWLCLNHHRGVRGVHVLTAADWEAQKYVRHLTD